MNSINFISPPSAGVGDILASPVLWAGALGALVTIVGILINNFFIERHKINEFNRQRISKKEDNSYEIRKEAYLDFCAAVTNFCSNLHAMVDPNQSDQKLAFNMDLSSVGRVYMVASPELVNDTMVLVSEMEHAHRSTAIRLTKSNRLKHEIKAKYALFDARQGEILARLQSLRAGSEGEVEKLAEIQNFINAHAEFSASAEQGRAELEVDLYRTQLRSLELVAIHVHQVENFLLPVLFHMRNDIDLKFDALSVLKAMNAEHKRKATQLEKLIENIGF